MCDPYGDAGNDVAHQLLGTVRPEPVQDGKVDEEEFLPLGESVGGQESITERLGEEAIHKVLDLKIN